VRLDLRHLRVLVAVADAGSINAAARVLEVSQPTLTVQLQRIERACGVDVFERDHTGVHPTDAGRVILRHARSIVGQLEGLAPDQPGLAEPSRVEVYGSGDAMRVLLPALVRSRPEVSWVLRSGPFAAAARAVEAGGCDLALVTRWPHARSLQSPVLTRQEVHAAPLRLLVPVGREPRAVEGLEDLADEFFVLRAGTDSRRALLAECGRAGFAPRIRAVVDDPANVAALVAGSVGVAMEPVVGPPPPGVRTLAYPGAACFRWEALYRRGCGMESIVADLVEIAEAAAAGPGPQSGDLAGTVSSPGR
jgi:DNA-binding transcriptional LysR family regulator